MLMFACVLKGLDTVSPQLLLPVNMPALACWLHQRLYALIDFASRKLHTHY